MTQIAWVLLAGAIVFAVIDWVAVVRGNRRLRWVAKPAVIVLLIGLAPLLQRSSGPERAAFAVALLFCLAGDLFLLAGDRWFRAGLAAFLVAHLGYAAGFLVGGVNRGLIVAAVVAVGIVSLGFGSRVLRAILQSGGRRMAGPVAAYVVAISAMLVLAVASGKPIAVAGALLFYASDGMIAWDRFVRPLPWSPLPVMVTYHLGQFLLVLSLAS
jgi:alkenylglycerophosphocholine hydrolase